MEVNVNEVQEDSLSDGSLSSFDFQQNNFQHYAHNEANSSQTIDTFDIIS
jgi:hypothetical protein